MGAAIRHELKVRAQRARVAAALQDRQTLEDWHGAAVGREGDTWTLRYPQGPIFRWQVVEESPSRVVWRCKEGPGDAPGTFAAFDLKDHADGRTTVEFEHRGWPHEDGSFRKCNTLWAILLDRLARSSEAAEADR